ncbi:MAG: DUF5615 family PIN-like protein [Micropruina glycogenica]
MRLLLDQNLSRHLPAILAAAGFDVVDTRSLGMQRRADEAIADFAAEDDRIVVSADTDFGTILARRQLAKPSFVLLRRTQNLGPDEVGSLLVRNLPAFERDLNEGAIVVIDDTVARVRRLPITPV